MADSVSAVCAVAVRVRPHRLAASVLRMADRVRNGRLRALLVSRRHTRRALLLSAAAVPAAADCGRDSADAGDRRPLVAAVIGTGAGAADAHVRDAVHGLRTARL